MFTDSHCHIYNEYYDNIDELLKICYQNNINRFINNGCDNKSNHEVIKLINKYDNMYGAIGIHPEYANIYQDSDIEYIKDNIKNIKVVAIGEIGLDYHYENYDKVKQIDLFEKQLKIAEDNNIPVIIHSREATNDTINILQKYKVKGVIHSFSGSLETAKKYISMGYLLGINGVITFKNCNLKDILNNDIIDNIIFETDSPFLTPEPFRGKQNNPSHIIDIVNYISKYMNIDMETLSKKSNDNLLKMFKI